MPVASRRMRSFVAPRVGRRGDVGRQVHNGVVTGHRGVDGGRVEQVDPGRPRPLGSESGRFRVGAGECGHVVAGRDQRGDDEPPGGAGATGQEHLHASTSCSQATVFAAASGVTAAPRPATMSASVVRRSSSLHAASAWYMAWAIVHTVR
jgi:hypothetical protein